MKYPSPSCRGSRSLALTLATLSAGILLHAAAPPTPQGLITGKAFTGITGTAVTALTGNAKFPDAPDQIFYLPYFEWNATGDIFTPPGNWADNYGTQIRGYFYPPTTGDYVFYLAADDNAELHLSTDGDPANKKLIARESVYSNPREYLSSGGASDLTAKDSSTFTGTQWPVLDPVFGGAKITLQAGQPYYIEALAKEGTGGDNLSVAAYDVTGVTLDSTMPIPGQYLSSDRSNGPVSIVTPPASQSVPERGSVTFTVVADGTPPYSYQWKRNGEDIPDATAIAYTLPSATVADSGAMFSVTVTGAEGGSTTSTAGTLTVVPDTEPPTLLGAKGLPSLTEIILNFSEALDPVTAGTTGNYQVSSAGGALNVSAATVNGSQVTLTTAAQTLGTKYTVTVNGVRDSAATPNSVAADSRAIFFPAGRLMQDANGFIVFEAENYDRNLDGRWVIDTTRGTPSGGASVVVPNGAGGNESGTQLEYDVEIQQAGTYYVWFRASGDNGNDDSSWLWLDGARPAERDPANGAAANSASMTGFQPQSDFVWRSDSQDGPDPFTVDIFTTGPHVIALARREDGAFHDKFILTLDPAFTPTGVGPAETRPGAPGSPTVALTAPTAGQTFTAGADIQLSATAAGQSGLEITRVEFSANGMLIGTVTASPFNFTWNDVAAGPYSLRAVAFDELGQSTATENFLITVEEAGPKTSARIAWVSFHPADNMPSSAAAAAGFTSASDIGYTDLITASGHQITRIVTSGTPDVALLNAFDLVIISRAVPSGDYQDPPETAAWNGITAPVMLLGGYGARANRLGFYVGNTIPDTVGPVTLAVSNPAHPIFEGVTITGGITANPYADVVSFMGTVERGISVVTDPPAGAGVALASIATDTDPTFGGAVIVEWQAGDTLANGAADTLGGHRLIFLTGSREHNGLTSEGAGIYDLTEDGARMFLNAVNYMSGVVPSPAPTLSHARTASGLTITYTGTLQSADNPAGPWTNVTGATSPFAVTADQDQKYYRANQ